MRQDQVYRGTPLFPVGFYPTGRIVPLQALFCAPALAYLRCEVLPASRVESIAFTLVHIAGQSSWPVIS